MTDFSKPGEPGQPAGDPGAQPPGYPPPPQGGYGPPPQGGYPPPPQGGYGQPGGYPTAPGGYASAPPVPPGYGPPPAGGMAFPAGVELAGRGRRVGAFFLAIPLSIVTLGIGYLIWGLVWWGKGKSPALGVLGMRVWNVREGRPATFGTMALRDIVGYIAQSILSIITLLVSFVLFLSTEKRQSLMDVVGGTVVVYDPNKVLG